MLHNSYELGTPLYQLMMGAEGLASDGWSVEIKSGIMCFNRYAYETPRGLQASQSLSIIETIQFSL